MNTFNNRTTSNGIKPMNQQLQEQLKALEEQQELENQQKSALSFEWPRKLTEQQRILFGAGLREARLKADMTQGKLAKLVNVADNYISNLETGKVANVDKPLIKKIGNFLRDDFNELMKNVCTPVRKIISEKSAFALPATLETDQEQTYKVKGQNFELKCVISEKNFHLFIDKNGQEMEIYQGRREKNHLFLQALDKIVGLIRKGI